LLSVALSLGSPPPGVTRHLHSLEPGLSSPEAIKLPRRSPDPLARRLLRAGARFGKDVHAVVLLEWMRYTLWYAGTLIEAETQKAPFIVKF